MASLPKTLGRVPVEDEVAGLKVTVTPLGFELARELLPDVARFLTKAATLIGVIAASGVKGTDDIKKLLAFLPQLDAESMGLLMELLNKHAKRLLSTTVVEMEHPIKGETENFELGKDKDRAMVFDEHPEAYVPICLMAGRVTFARFFPATAQPEGETPAAES